jgi:hypothetical protein
MKMNYKYMKQSQCRHDQTVVGAIDKIRNRRNLLEKTAEASIVLGCFALGLAPELYSSTAQRILDQASRY